MLLISEGSMPRTLVSWFVKYLLIRWLIKTKRIPSLVLRAIDNCEVADVLSKELNRTIEYVNPSTSAAKSYWIDVRGIGRTYATIMGLLYVMTRFNTAKKVKSIFRDVMNEDPTDLCEFVRKNRNAWI